MTGFKHKSQIQVRFKDVDTMGHVNNANHLTYFELARMSYFKSVVAEEIDWKRQGIILARTEIDYKNPILLEDEIWVHIRMGRIGNSSFEMEYCIERISNGITQIAAEGKSVQVCYDYEKNCTIPVPESWRTKVQKFESSEALS